MQSIEHVRLRLEPDGYLLDASARRDEHRRPTQPRSQLDPSPVGKVRTGLECSVARDVLGRALRNGLAGFLEGPGAEALGRWRRDETLASYLAAFRWFDDRA